MGACRACPYHPRCAGCNPVPPGLAWGIPQEALPVNFGFSIPGRGPLADPDLILKLAPKAEHLGYSSLFVTDHVVLPIASRSVYPYQPSGQFPGGYAPAYLAPLTLMGYLAAATQQIR